ncbi:diaminopimelate epimerase [Zeaxanthinibacter sp. PT1]|uniref:diaminopimelate epimerase n=1 Tax=Zeaxanthinibacter TaxID=561554 RepID=UPI00234B321E|nr:diaminopimelate epimerase [Zeaxanthinibacter sp. PT1]MDC6351768.1 diaminopimelate epimerase [Zeaxanthinibacter sp. PT1]
MDITFYKYQGTGNDFIMIDNRQFQFNKNDTKLIASLCDRRFGIGADGLILLETDPDYDFRMVYYNADGGEGSMCGNGGRCIVAFASDLEVIGNEARFIAVDGPHTANIEGELISLKMQDVHEIEQNSKYYYLNTGSPHHVQEIQELDTFPVREEGAKIRYDRYGEAGSNINFVKHEGDKKFYVRTYERGVEDETYSCGTGVTAVALAMHGKKDEDPQEYTIRTLGGELKVRFVWNGEHYSDIYLLGPAERVFKGSVQC